MSGASAEGSDQRAEQLHVGRRLSLLDAGRETQATAMDMICESLRQSEKDIKRWKEMSQRTRENGNGNH